MKPLIEKLHLARNTSFVAKTYRTPQFEVPWHQHVEYELILFTEGEGTSFIGNYIGEFKTGDVFFIGSNLPHTFQKANKDLITSAVVVQFREDFWGKEFMHLPECRNIKDLLDISMRGLRIKGKIRNALNQLVKEIEFANGINRIIKLIECLSVIADNKEFDAVSTQEVNEFNLKNRERLDKVYQYTIENFQERIELKTIAGLAGMSIPAFCNYFKKSTKKTYIDFLNEIKIGYVCKQLIDTQKSIESICYESGFNTLANFNKQFLKFKQITPSRYRKDFINNSAEF